MGEGAAGADADAVSVNSLTFEYPGQGWALADLSLQLRKGSRCLLIGANGAGEPRSRRRLMGSRSEAQLAGSGLLLRSAQCVAWRTGPVYSVC